MADGLLLLHAFPLDASMWGPQVAALSGRYNIVAPNLPGFGDAAQADPASWMDAAADQAAEALTAAGIDRAVVCGLSMGGYVALAFWRRHADRVAGIILANTRSGADDDVGKQRRRDLAAKLAAEGNGFLADSPPPLLSATARPELLERMQAIIRKLPADSIANAALAMAERVDSTPDLAGINVPAMVITSTGDTLIPAAASEPMAQEIPGARLEVIPEAGHLSNVEAPEEFNRLLVEHLERSGVSPKA